MDSDIRQSGIHNLLGMGEVMGLAEYLRGEIDVQHIFRRTEMEKLTVLPGGRAPHNPA
jgi:MinD-like ATPase involved in chromosome partitioning or flagellar assembly